MDTFDAYVGEAAAIMEETQNFAGEDELSEILGGDFGDIEGFADDIADFTQDASEEVNPYLYASVKGERKVKKKQDVLKETSVRIFVCKIKRKSQMQG